MKIAESYVKFLIREALKRKDLLLERKTDKYYDIMNNKLLSALTNPEANMFPLGWYNRNGEGPYNSGKYFEIPGQKSSRLVKKGSFHEDDVDYLDNLNILESYYKVGDRRHHKLEQLRPIYEKLTEGDKELYDYFSFVYVIKTDAVERLSKETYDQINDESFLDFRGIRMFFNQISVKLLPAIKNSGGSMNAYGQMKINCGYSTGRYDKHLNSLPRLTPPPDPFDGVSGQKLPPPPGSRMSEEQMFQHLMKDETFLPSFHHRHPKTKEAIVKQRLLNFNSANLGDDALSRALSFANCTASNFNSLLKSADQTLESVIYHEGTHYINAIRAKYNNDYRKTIHYRDSGLRSFQKRTGGERGPGSSKYTLSTEELSARYNELRFSIKKSLRIVYDTFVNIFIDNPFYPGTSSPPTNLKERQKIFLKILSEEYERPSGQENAAALADTVNYLMKNQKSKAVNDLLQLSHQADNPFDDTLTTVYGSDNWIVNTIFATYGPRDTWETKEGKDRIGRVYNRVIELVELIDEWLKDHDLK